MTNLMTTYPPPPVTFVRGKGSRLWDADGHEYVDFLSEFTAGLFGHSHPAIRKAIAAGVRITRLSTRPRT